MSELKTNAQNLQIQKEEVDAVRLFTFDEIHTCMQQKHTELSIVPADMSYYTFVMNEVLKLPQ